LPDAADRACGEWVLPALEPLAAGGVEVGANLLRLAKGADPRVQRATDEHRLNLANIALGVVVAAVAHPHAAAKPAERPEQTVIEVFAASILVCR
jgi:hypothetical protein